MEEDRLPEQVKTLENVLERKKRKGRPETTWMYGICGIMGDETYRKGFERKKKEVTEDN